MQVLSINAHTRLQRFVDQLPEVDMLLVQEWGTHAEDRSALAHQAATGFAHVHATRYLLAASHTPFEVLHVEERVQVLRLNEGVFVNVYFPAASGRPREALLLHLRDSVLSDHAPVELVVGDFNLAPRPEDGWHGAEHSTWTKAYERTAFAGLCQTHGLIDLGAQAPWAATFERLNRGKMTSFRCDLALARPDTFRLSTYLHELRRSKATDHSGLLLER